MTEQQDTGQKDRLLTKKERDKAWEDTFEEPVSFDHKPTVEEIFDMRLKSVTKAQDTKTTPMVRTEVREGMIVELSERIRADDEGAVIIRVGTQTEKGVEFNDWWRMFRR